MSGWELLRKNCWDARCWGGHQDKESNWKYHSSLYSCTVTVTPGVRKRKRGREGERLPSRVLGGVAETSCATAWRVDGNLLTAEGSWTKVSGLFLNQSRWRKEKDRVEWRCTESVWRKGVSWGATLHKKAAEWRHIVSVGIACVNSCRHLDIWTKTSHRGDLLSFVLFFSVTPQTPEGEKKHGNYL